jgi:hypothetical protein
MYKLSIIKILFLLLIKKLLDNNFYFTKNYLKFFII